MEDYEHIEALEKRIAVLERERREALAGQVHVYHFADAYLEKASVKHLTASGVIITLTALGGREIVGPTLIRDGLSEETVKALRADMVRSYKSAIELKPKGYAHENQDK